MAKLHLIHLEYVTIYHTYPLLYYKGHIQITSNGSNINVETIKE